MVHFTRLFAALSLFLFTAVKSWNNCNLLDFGATGDGVTSDDKAFRLALACLGSGGTLDIPAGTYLLSPFNVTSNMDLYLSSSRSVLLADASLMLEWPLVEAYPSYDPGDGFRLAPFIGGNYISNTTIRGSGTIDGQGVPWWAAKKEGGILTHDRPRLVEPMYCSNFSMVGVTVKDPPFWAMHPYACEYLLFENIIFSAALDSPNTDGIDPDSCGHVLIKNLTVLGTGDDAIAIKSGKDQWGRAFNRPSHDIVVEGGSIGPSSGINLGSEMSGGIFNVVIRGVSFHHSMFAVRIKSGRGRGGYVRNIVHEDLVFDQVAMGLAINMHYADETNVSSPMADSTPHLDDIVYRRIRGTAITAGALLCLVEAPCRGVVLDDVDVESRVGGWECAFIHGQAEGVVSPTIRCLETEA